MSEHLSDAAYQGEIEIGENRSPTSYRLRSIKDEQNRYRVKASLMAPRDWLLKQGFDKQARLIRSDGKALSMLADDALTVDDNISVALHAEDLVFSSPQEMLQEFPELRE